MHHYQGVVIKYNEPPEARKPKTRWRLYPFKGEEELRKYFKNQQTVKLTNFTCLLIVEPSAAEFDFLQQKNLLLLSPIVL